MIAGVFTLLSSRMVISHWGKTSFGFVTLIVSMAAVMQFSDVGLGAVLTNAAATTPPEDPELLRTIVSAVRVLVLVSACVILGSLLLEAVNLWPTLLGVQGDDGLHAGRAATLFLVLFAVGIPLGIGGRLLVGAGRTPSVFLIQALSQPLTYAILLVLSTLRSPAWTLVCAWGLSIAAISSISTLYAGSVLSFRLRSIASLVPRFKDYTGVSIRATAIPMAVVMVATPLALQSDRIIISHRSGLNEVAFYSLAALLYVPAWSVISAAGLSLWPWFARRRNRGVGSRGSLIKAVLLFTSVGLLGGLTILFVGPYVLPIASAGSISVPRQVLLAAGATLLVMAFHTPSAMVLTDSRGLRFQAVAVCFMLIANLTISWFLTPRLGAAGPYWGTAIGVLSCMALPSLVVALRRATEFGHKLEPREEELHG